MAFPTAVNDQITDSVTQANTKVLGDAPAIAMGNLYQVTSQALANAAHNATTNQQSSYLTTQAAIAQGIATLYAVDTASTGRATSRIVSPLAGRDTLSAQAAEVTPEVNADHVIGYIHALLNSPQGKTSLQEAVDQARASAEPDADAQANMNVVQKELEDAIGVALEAGVPKQAVCYILHQVAHERGLNMLYPAAHAPNLTAEDIEKYYQAMIGAYKHEA